MTDEHRERPRRRYHARPGEMGRPPRGGSRFRVRAFRPRHTGSLRERQTMTARGMSDPAQSGNGEGVRIPEPARDTVRIIPLGGVEEIGRNMSLVEFRNDIVVVDCGFQFREEDTPGVDYILPNTKYLEERKGKIRGVFITHGHLDHIGGIPYIIDRLGYPPIYSRRLTTYMIRKRQEEFPHLKKLDIREIEKEEKIACGELTVRTFSVTHTIPDSMGLIIDTPYGSVVHTGDLKLDHTDGVPSAREEEEFARFKKENILLLMADSTNVEKGGFSMPEYRVYETLERLVRDTPGRLIVGTFSSQLERITRLIGFAEKHGRKVVVEGRSMKTNVEIVKELGFLKAKKDTFISMDEVEQYPPKKILILATGAQGDRFAALMRSAMGDHKSLKINKSDTIVLSSSVVPGNERAVQKLKDNLSRLGGHIIHHDMDDVHSSGHAYRDESAWIQRHIGAKFFMPQHGYHYMLRVHADIARSLGTPKENVVMPDNGSVIEIVEGGKRITVRKEKAASGLRLVDGFSIGDIQEVVIRDRRMLAEDGMFVVIATVNPKTGRLRKSPDIISRGFVYLRESQDLLAQTRLLIKKNIEDTAAGQNPINFDIVKTAVTDAVSRFLFQQTNKKPIVIPVILGV